MGGGHPWSLVTADLEALLTALYVLIDDHVIPSGPRRPGHPKKLSDAELACLAVAQVPLVPGREHNWLRMCYARLGHMFPYLPKQPGYPRAAEGGRPVAGRGAGPRLPVLVRPGAADRCHARPVRHLPEDGPTGHGSEFARSASS